MALPIVQGEWSEATGAVTLTVGADVSDPEIPETVSHIVERSINQGVTWELVQGAGTGGTLTDPEALSNGFTWYRVTAMAASGAAAASEIQVLSTSQAVWIGGGIGYALEARLPNDPQVKISAARDRSLERYSGRSLAVAYAGEQLSRIIDLSGRVLDETVELELVARLVDLVQNPEPVFMYRDPDGRRIYGVIRDIAFTRVRPTLWAYALKVEETEH